MLERATIDALTAATIVNQRTSRYRAEEQAVSLAELGSDAGTVVALYRTLVAIKAALGGDRAALRAAAGEIRVAHDLPALMDRVRNLGSEASSDRVAQALHDIRGGSLSAWVLHFSRLARGETNGTRDLELMTRDQMKITRTVVHDLDIEGRAQDLQPKPHSVGHLIDALGAFAAELDGTRIEVALTVEVEEPRSVMLAASCTELGAIDRITYNLLNNAVRFTARPSVDVSVAIIGPNLRVVVANEVRPEQQRAVREAMADDRAALFGSFTTGGTGYGLRIARELVARAYGISDERALTSEGYLGAKLVRETFVSWFYWPLL